MNGDEIPCAWFKLLSRRSSKNNYFWSNGGHFKNFPNLVSSGHLIVDIKITFFIRKCGHTLFFKNKLKSSKFKQWSIGKSIH